VTTDDSVLMVAEKSGVKLGPDRCALSVILRGRRMGRRSPCSASSCIFCVRSSQASSLLANSLLLGGESTLGCWARSSLMTSSFSMSMVSVRVLRWRLVDSRKPSSSVPGWLFGRRLLRLSLRSSARGEVILCLTGPATLDASYSTVMRPARSPRVGAGSDLRVVGLGLRGSASSAESEPRGDVLVFRRRTFTISGLSLLRLGDSGSTMTSTPARSLSFALPEPLLTGRSSLPELLELEGFEGRRCRGAGLFCPVLLLM
jgi:hypothetical protein